jgi:hypothetical protein
VRILAEIGPLVWTDPCGVGTLPAALTLLAAQASSARLSRLKAAPRGDPGAELPAPPAS